MTLCIAPQRQSHVLTFNPVVSASLLVLLTVSSACGSDETVIGRAVDPKRPREVEDAGPQCAPFNLSFRNQLKACSVDADCEVAEVSTGCRDKRAVYGVATADREEFDECAPSQDALPECSSRPPAPRAEDTRVAAPDLSNVEARCVSGACQTRIGERVCGSPERVCTRLQLCASFLNGVGVPQYTCVDNPCGDKPLDCKCAAPVCVAAGEGMHACTVGQIEDADVFCKDEHR